MQEHAVHEHSIKLDECVLFSLRAGRQVGQGGAALALDNSTAAHQEGFAGKHPFDPGKRGGAAGGELKLEHFVAAHRVQATLHQTGSQHRLRFGGEDKAALGLGVVERFDAEGIASQEQGAAHRIVQGQSVHAPQSVHEAGALASIEMKGRLAVRSAGKGHPVQFLAQFPIVINFSIADQGAALRINEGLGPAVQVDDGQAGVDQPHVGANVASLTVRAAMG